MGNVFEGGREKREGGKEQPKIRIEFQNGLCAKTERDYAIMVLKRALSQDVRIESGTQKNLIMIAMPTTEYDPKEISRILHSEGFTKFKIIKESREMPAVAGEPAKERSGVSAKEGPTKGGEKGESGGEKRFRIEGSHFFGHLRQLFQDHDVEIVKEEPEKRTFEVVCGQGTVDEVLRRAKSLISTKEEAIIVKTVEEEEQRREEKAETDRKKRLTIETPYPHTMRSLFRKHNINIIKRERGIFTVECAKASIYEIIYALNKERISDTEVEKDLRITKEEDITEEKAEESGDGSAATTAGVLGSVTSDRVSTPVQERKMGEPTHKVTLIFKGPKENIDKFKASLAKQLGLPETAQIDIRTEKKGNRRDYYCTFECDEITKRGVEETVRNGLTAGGAMAEREINVKELKDRAQQKEGGSVERKGGAIKVEDGLAALKRQPEEAAKEGKGKEREPGGRKKGKETRVEEESYRVVISNVGGASEDDVKKLLTAIPGLEEYSFDIMMQDYGSGCSFYVTCSEGLIRQVQQRLTQRFGGVRIENTTATKTILRDVELPRVKPVRLDGTSGIEKGGGKLTEATAEGTTKGTGEIESAPAQEAGVKKVVTITIDTEGFPRAVSIVKGFLLELGITDDGIEESPGSEEKQIILKAVFDTWRVSTFRNMIESDPSRISGRVNIAETAKVEGAIEGKDKEEQRVGVSLSSHIISLLLFLKGERLKGHNIFLEKGSTNQKAKILCSEETAGVIKGIIREYYTKSITFEELPEASIEKIESTDQGEEKAEMGARKAKAAQKEIGEIRKTGDAAIEETKSVAGEERREKITFRFKRGRFDNIMPVLRAVKSIIIEGIKKADIVDVEYTKPIRLYGVESATIRISIDTRHSNEADTDNLCKQFEKALREKLK